MKFGNLVRANVGTLRFYEYALASDRDDALTLLRNYASRYECKLLTDRINGFNVKTNTPVYILKVQVSKTGKPLKKRGINIEGVNLTR